MDLVVIGLGYVGLPLVREAVRAGLRVAGLDRSRAVVEGLESGVSHVDDVSDDEVKSLLAEGFRPTLDEAVLRGARTVVICVPTPLSDSQGPDLGAVRAAAEAVADRLEPGTLVVLESTTYPGTTEDVVRPVLEKGGLVAGADFALVFSPERIDPGNREFGLRNTPKIVGGLTPACTRAGVDFYGRLVERVVPARGLREAEMAKLLENTYRHINIALMNEMAMFCHELEIDIWDVIDCAGTKPFGFQPFRPGPGVGGHCIPIDPNYLSYKVRTLGYPFRFVELAQEINARMPEYVVRRAQQMLNRRGKALKDSRVLLLGVTYKADVGDQRESPALPVATRLAGLGARVSFHDPHVPRWEVDGRRLSREDDLRRALDEADLAVLLTDHAQYGPGLLTGGHPPLLDTRGRFRGAPGAAVELL
ncbi:UDP-N-acetyl-D-glucosamine dehydrogenase [Streptomyces sp. M1013]|uniref:nucleotide sugar dehydrogenase n=1 Tax=Streptomyces sp. M1013 TaxID=549798 RepID=UPI0009790398|nr:nucleotide sugar dehydrogenase [Streptomyces sp. M1013]OMI89377.1 UDP-N-acetyl-D-glucosamine dehydrogenase [Streptomyces sp. M1013]